MTGSPPSRPAPLLLRWFMARRPRTPGEWGVALAGAFVLYGLAAGVVGAMVAAVLLL